MIKSSYVSMLSAYLNERGIDRRTIRFADLESADPA